MSFTFGLGTPYPRNAFPGFVRSSTISLGRMRSMRALVLGQGGADLRPGPPETRPYSRSSPRPQSSIPWNLSWGRTSTSSGTGTTMPLLRWSRPVAPGPPAAGDTCWTVWWFHAGGLGSDRNPRRDIILASRPLTSSCRTRTCGVEFWSEATDSPGVIHIPDEAGQGPTSGWRRTPPAGPRSRPHLRSSRWRGSRPASRTRDRTR